MGNLRNNAPEISTLTPLRGIGAIIVMAYHFYLAFVLLAPSGNSFLQSSYVLVDRFFIMSGFIMIHVYRNKFMDGIKYTDIRKFLVARLARVYPLHVFLLSIYILLIVMSGHYKNNNPTFSTSSIFSNLFLIQSFGIHKVATWNISSWSISAEWWSYIFFPIMCFLLYKIKWTTIILMSIGIILLYISIMYFLPRQNYIKTQPNFDVSYQYGFLRGLAGFSAGMLTYLLYLKVRVKKFFDNDFLAAVFFFGTIAMMETKVYDLIYIPVLMLLTLSFACNNKMVCKICKLKPLQFLGNISYSIYMIHDLVLLILIQYLKKQAIYINGPIFKNFTAALPYFFTFGLIVISLSIITFYLVEKPSRKLVNNMFNSKHIGRIYSGVSTIEAFYFLMQRAMQNESIKLNEVVIKPVLEFIYSREHFSLFKRK